MSQIVRYFLKKMFLNLTLCAYKNSYGVILQTQQGYANDKESDFRWNYQCIELAFH